ncbi:Phenylacetic acid catabolic protein [Piscinibacter sakaiensis]|uniref:Phenylacetic acid catabolic protein n=1 Tax=Piscinibacter sakaiensis TaxID=1547922 RepID=A0A0K8NWJ2_PISS1|nr:Phenylacetic acid catabolic protein [Piscinibacter sakaiensis]GAP34310.1 phenylacetic acid catabolic protein [Piscinibacter sakaiensis]
MTLTRRIEDRRLFRRASELSDDARKYIVKMLTVQLQSEYADAPDRVSAVCPTVEDKTWLDLQMMQEKAHGLGVARILEDMGVDPAPLIAQAEASVSAGDRKLDYFKMPMEDWVERSMTRVLAERTGGIQSIGGLGSSYIPLAVWNAKNYIDEALGHTAMGVSYAQRLMKEGQAEACQAAVDKFYPSCLDIFGGVGTPNEKRYLELGVKTLTNNQSRALWVTSLERDLDALGLKMPDARWQGIRGAYPAESTTDFGMYLEVADFPARHRPLAARLIAGWMTAKYARQNEWGVFIAPTPTLKLEVAQQMRQDRAWGLQLARMLRELDVDPNPIATEAERSREAPLKVDFLKQEMPQNWEGMAVHQYVAARAQQAASLASFGSSLIPLAVWAGVHYEGQEQLAEAWLARLRQAPTWAVHSAGQRALDACIGHALDVFGADGSRNESACFEAGLKTASNAECRRVFVELLREDLPALGLRLPDLAHGVRGRYRVDMPVAEAA